MSRYFFFDSFDLPSRYEAKLVMVPLKPFFVNSLSAHSTPLSFLFLSCRAIIDAMAFWNDYLLPSLVLAKKELYTIPIATQVFYGPFCS